MQGVSQSAWGIGGKLSSPDDNLPTRRNSFKGRAQDMRSQPLKRWILTATIILAFAYAGAAAAQDAGSALNHVQQSPPKSALSSAIASKFPTHATPGPSALSDPG